MGLRTKDVKLEVELGEGGGYNGDPRSGAWEAVAAGTPPRDGSAFGRRGAAAPATSRSSPRSPASPSTSAMEPEVTRLLRSARFVPLIALKHAAEAHSVNATEGERVVEAVVIFADVSGKAAPPVTEPLTFGTHLGRAKKGRSSWSNINED